MNIKKTIMIISFVTAFILGSFAGLRIEQQHQIQVSKQLKQQIIYMEEQSLQNKIASIPKITPIPAMIQTPTPTPSLSKDIYIGTYNMSHYTNETGSHVPSYEGGSVDRKGNKLVPYESIAIPKNLLKTIPYGTKVKIVTGNKVYYGKAVDTGGALQRLNRIDRCVGSYNEAAQLGVIKNVKLYVVK